MAGGVYTPTTRVDPSDPRTATFSLKEGVAVYGGFAEGASTFEQRDFAANLTILRGDLDHNDITDAGVVTDIASIQGGNAYRVVTSRGGLTSAPTIGWLCHHCR
ncbi:MAG: hypothetical protein ACOYYS_19915 [Chloroflexota bacterium]